MAGFLRKRNFPRSCLEHYSAQLLYIQINREKNAIFSCFIDCSERADCCSANRQRQIALGVSFVIIKKYACCLASINTKYPIEKSMELPIFKDFSDESIKLSYSK